MGISPRCFFLVFYCVCLDRTGKNGLKAQRQVGPRFGQGEQNPNPDPKSLSLSLPLSLLFAYVFVLLECR